MFLICYERIDYDYDDVKCNLSKLEITMGLDEEDSLLFENGNHKLNRTWTNLQAFLNHKCPNLKKPIQYTFDERNCQIVFWSF